MKKAKAKTKAATRAANNGLEPNWLIVGLGNPGPEYERTRHNLGFMLVDMLARESQTQIKRDGMPRVDRYGPKLTTK